MWLLGVVNDLMVHNHWFFYSYQVQLAILKLVIPRYQVSRQGWNLEQRKKQLHSSLFDLSETIQLKDEYAVWWQTDNLRQKKKNNGGKSWVAISPVLLSTHIADLTLRGQIRDLPTTCNVISDCKSDSFSFLFYSSLSKCMFV